jgi:hypothetical protein
MAVFFAILTVCIQINTNGQKKLVKWRLSSPRKIGVAKVWQTNFRASDLYQTWCT